MSRQSRSTAQSSPSAPVRRSRRRVAVPFLASVRFADGSRNMYEISNAQNVADARRMILDELSGVVSAMIVVPD